MSNSKVHLHTVKIGQRINMTATQKYIIMDGGEYHYLGSYDYAMFDHQHLVAIGTIQGSHVEKITEIEVQKTFDRVLESRNKYGN